MSKSEKETEKKTRSRDVLKEGALIGFATLTGFTAMALSSYSAEDRLYSVTENAMGPVGASLADALFSGVGIIAYGLLPILIVPVVMLFRDQKMGVRLRISTVLERIVGFALLISAGTALTALCAPVEQALPQGNGGHIGGAIATKMLAAFHMAGSTLILSAVAIMGAGLLFNVTLSQVVKLISGGASGAMSGMRRGIQKLAAKIEVVLAMAKAEYVRRREQHAARAMLKDQEKVIRARERTVNDNLKAEAKSRLAQKRLTARTLPSFDKRPAVSPTDDISDEEVGRTAPIKPAPEEVLAPLPELGLLDKLDTSAKLGFSESELESMSRLLEQKLGDFNIKAQVVGIYPGPVVTRFEIEPDAGVKASKITNLAKDLARSLSVVSVRVVEVIPGKSYVGVEIPNEDRQIVNFQQVLGSDVFRESESILTLALGHDIAGEPIVADLAKMPHLLVAGTTGSGKSVGVNAMLLSLLYKASPEELRLLLVDPKMLELSVYDNIPHLLAPVVTDMKHAANGLKWCVAEMERRYRLMAAMGVRNLAGYNNKILQAKASGKPLRDPFWMPDDLLEENDTPQEAPELDKLPAIVVVIDEFADMIMVVGKKVEELIARIAQKARAAGIHLILATQRPSVDVITGLIKANIPTRIAFQVSSRIDSRTVIDQGGAEQLLGHGDMLYLPPGSGVPLRVHGAFVSDEEVHRVAADWKKRGKPDYIDGVLESNDISDYMPSMKEDGEGGDEDNELYDQAVHFVTQAQKVSISSLQRKLRIGYNRSARLVEMMEEQGVVSEPANNGSREVLAPPPPK